MVEAETAHAGASISVVAWNSEWLNPGSVRGELGRSLIEALRPDILCVTEAYLGLCPNYGHCITATADYGYQSDPARRKVMLWSASPWEEVDVVGSAELPSGRFVSGVTATTLGRARVAGVCIPWRDAHVRTGRRGRAPWEDHRTYVQGLAKIIERLREQAPLILAGDCNQRIPGSSRAPADVQALLLNSLQGLVLHTGGDHGSERIQLIDHVASTPDLAASEVEILPFLDESGKALSDHTGASVRLSRGASRSR